MTVEKNMSSSDTIQATLARKQVQVLCTCTALMQTLDEMLPKVLQLRARLTDRLSTLRASYVTDRALAVRYFYEARREEVDVFYAELCSARTEIGHIYERARFAQTVTAIACTNRGLDVVKILLDRIASLVKDDSYINPALYIPELHGQPT